MLSFQPSAEILQAKSLFIFDFDGTIADTTPLHAQAFLQVLQPHGLSLDYREIAGMRTADAVRRILVRAGREASGELVESLSAAKQRLVRRLIRERLRPLPGVHSFLCWARERHRLSLYSSGSRGSVGIALEKLGYLGWFDPLLCAEDVQRAKPDPEGYLKVLELTGTAPREALVFEDSDAGLAAAARAQIAAVDVRPPFDFELFRVLELVSAEELGVPAGSGNPGA